MSERETGQVAASAAEVYEAFFVPALFAAWPAHVLGAAGVRAGDRVLDVACGTGILARVAAGYVGAHGTVTGVDINPAMLAVARSKSAQITWQQAPAEALPFESGAFDRVVSQFALMFFEDRVRAVTEMRRVARPGGGIAFAVWASLAETPGYAAMTELLGELFGATVAQALQAPYALGDRNVLAETLSAAGVTDARVETVPGKARFPSLEAWIHTDIRGWTLADVIDDAAYARIVSAAPSRLSAFVRNDGTVEFDAPAHVITVPPG